MSCTERSQAGVKDTFEQLYELYPDYHWTRATLDCLGRNTVNNHIHYSFVRAWLAYSYYNEIDQLGIHIRRELDIELSNILEKLEEDDVHEKTLLCGKWKINRLMIYFRDENTVTYIDCPQPREPQRFFMSAGEV